MTLLALAYEAGGGRPGGQRILGSLPTLHTTFLLVVGRGFLGTPAPTHMGCEQKGGRRCEAQEQAAVAGSWA